MLKLQYDLGNSPINIYVDRPSSVLEQLIDINVKFFIIGQHDWKEKSFRRVNYVTPDIKPTLVLSQSKFENFEIIMKFAQDCNVPFLHYETNSIPSNISKAKQSLIKDCRANINLFSNASLVREWEFDEAESAVIPIGMKITPALSDNEKLYHISNDLPILEMSKGICPIVLKNSTTSKFIKNAFNGFLFEKESDISFILNKLSKMEESDVRLFGENAKKTIIENFPYNPFIESWKKMLKSIIKHM